MQEPYFMQQLHRQRERDARIFWGRFKGDFEKYWQWQKDRLDKSLAEHGYCLKRNKKGSGFLVRDKRMGNSKIKSQNAKCNSKCKIKKSVKIC